MSGPPTAVDVQRPVVAANAKPAPLLDVLTAELKRSYGELAKQSEAPYYTSYECYDTDTLTVSASYGALVGSYERRHRVADIDVRVGSYKLDNTHHVETARPGRGQTKEAGLPIEDDPYAIRNALWLDTDTAYKAAVEQLRKVQAQAKVTVKSEDDSDDFSHETPREHFEEPARLQVDRAAWEGRLRSLSARFRAHPEVLSSSVMLSVNAETDYFVSSEGTRYQIPYVHARVTIMGTARRDDGSELQRTETFDAAQPDKLPSDEVITAKIDRVIADLDQLRKAPAADPYAGPAILEGKAAAVFFHEVFGHRVEGHRQKDARDGQTFGKKIGQPITASFIDVVDDPTIGTLGGVDLNGYYPVDDEGTPAQRTSLIERGVLKTFLLGRAPARGFMHSNGHGRRQEGRAIVARQGNLIVTAEHTVDPAMLRTMLLDEVKKQGKPYGLIFRELDGGFTLTERFSPQAFKLLPVMVYRLYPDGHEELVQGADLEGTPLTTLSEIRAAGNDLQTFNGYCGAESGFVPVSASAPSLLIGRVELTKKAKGNAQQPVLPAPGGAK